MGYHGYKRGTAREGVAMKKVSWLLIVLLIPVIILPVMVHGFLDKRLPLPLPDFYPVKLRNLTFFDLVSKDLDMLQWNQAELTESKPPELEVNLGELDLTEGKFGCFKFGNLGQKVWFWMRKDSDGYWSEFYIDQDRDQQIEKNERVKGFQTGQDSFQGIQRFQALSLVPVSLKVAYQGAKAEFERNLYFFIRTGVYQKKNLADSMVSAVTAGFLEGEFKVPDRGGSKMVKFRIMDANGNGCFNDYGTDLLMMDLNRDGYFRKKEIDKLAEYVVSSDKKHQWRVVVPPFPAKIAVVEVAAEIDSVALEPSATDNNVTPKITPVSTPANTPETTPKPSPHNSPKTGS
jgi:hypothetical protein